MRGLSVFQRFSVNGGRRPLGDVAFSRLLHSFSGVSLRSCVVSRGWRSQRALLQYSKWVVRLTTLDPKVGDLFQPVPRLRSPSAAAELRGPGLLKKIDVGFFQRSGPSTQKQPFRRALHGNADPGDKIDVRVTAEDVSAGRFHVGPGKVGNVGVSVLAAQLLETLRDGFGGRSGLC